MRIAHSFWTKPACQGRWAIDDQVIKDLWLFALSAHYVKKNGYPLVLHTDQVGEQLYGILPYDEIHRTLDNIDVPDVFWAAGKMHALRLEPLGTVHIDGDVFLKHPDVYEIIGMPGYDLIVQSYDWSGALMMVLKVLRPYLLKEFPWMLSPTDKTSVELSYNTGVFCFHNQELKDRYLDAYRDVALYLSRSKRLIEHLRINRHGDTAATNMCADLVVEQKMLRSIALSNGYRVHKIIDEVPTKDRAWMGAGGQTEIYDHFIWTLKYKQLDVIKETLRAQNPGLYDKVATRIAEFNA